MIRFLLMLAVLVAGFAVAGFNSAAEAHDNLVLVNGRLVRVNSFHHGPSVLRVQNVGHFHHGPKVAFVNGVRVSGRGVQVNAGRGVRVNVNGGARISSRSTPFRPRVGNVVRIR